MKNKFIVPAISVVLVVVAVLSAFLLMNYEKNKKVRLDESDVFMKDFIVDGNKLSVTLTSANSLGMKISGNSYVYEDGALKFRLYGNKNLTIGEPLTQNQVLDLVITAPGDIKEVYFLYLDSKGEEKESKKSFVRGKF
jgi:hypothetical protein